MLGCIVYIDYNKALSFGNIDVDWTLIMHKREKFDVDIFQHTGNLLSDKDVQFLLRHKNDPIWLSGGRPSDKQNKWGKRPLCSSSLFVCLAHKLTTKQLAELFNIRPNSVERIRNQLGIKPFRNSITPEINRLRNSEEIRNWSIVVKERDNWTCQSCGKRGGNLHAHHILGFVEYPELRTAVDNGVTLCAKCHCRLHKPTLKEKAS